MAGKTNIARQVICGRLRIGLSSAIRNNPQDVNGLKKTISFAYRIGRTETASRLAELLVSADIENSSSHFRAAYSYMCLRRYEDAIDSLRETMAIDPNWEGGHGWLLPPARIRLIEFPNRGNRRAIAARSVGE